jgi:hypothetical protein
MISKKHQTIIKRKRDRERYFEEQNQVRFSTGKEIIVYVKVEQGVNERCNHQDAEDIAKKQYPSLEIIRVAYC